MVFMTAQHDEIFMLSRMRLRARCGHAKRIRVAAGLGLRELAEHLSQDGVTVTVAALHR